MEQLTWWESLVHSLVPADVLTHRWQRPQGLMAIGLRTCKRTPTNYFFSQCGETLELPLKWTRHAKASTGLRYFRLYLIVIYFQRQSKLRLQLWVSYSSGMCCSPGLENVTSWDVSHPHATTRVQRQQCVPEPYPSKGQGQCSTQSPQNLLREREVKLPLELPCSSHTDWNLTNSSKCLENYVK